ncbi:hypothetical protein [Sphingomonas sp. NIC1]|uniref:hypothetical protein n=1 Tax=Sphingomonas sp. NIC1 TaxID=1961362 RepID=UPI0007C0D089|nr:hypothetical protein [Sphingomonas sp. NIC1]ANC85460.1 hypothetical protein A7E77_00235 [Sphingomonas sp. NIC1]
MAYNQQQFADGSVRENVTVASNVGATGTQNATTVYGGTYVFSAMANNWNGASVQLQALGPDGTTYQNLGSPKTANDATGGTSVTLGSNSVVRVNVTAANPTGLFATLSRVP